MRTASGGLQVSGRMLTIQSAKLAPVPASGSTAPSTRLTGTITATAYVLINLVVDVLYVFIDPRIRYG